MNKQSLQGCIRIYCVSSQSDLSQSSLLKPVREFMVVVARHFLDSYGNEVSAGTSHLYFLSFESLINLNYWPSGFSAMSYGIGKACVTNMGCI